MAVMISQANLITCSQRAANMPWLWLGNIGIVEQKMETTIILVQFGILHDCKKGDFEMRRGKGPET